MVPVFFVEDLVCSEQFYNRLEFFQRKPSFLAKFVPLFEAASPDNFVNHLSKSAHISSMSV